MTLTKYSLVDKVSAEHDIKPCQAKAALENLIEVIKSTLASGEDVMISGFGKFQVAEKAPRKGRNPATGKEMTLEKRRIVTFKCAGKLRDNMNSTENRPR